MQQTSAEFELAYLISLPAPIISATLLAHPLFQGCVCGSDRVNDNKNKSSVFSEVPALWPSAFCACRKVNFSAEYTNSVATQESMEQGRREALLKAKLKNNFSSKLEYLEIANNELLK